MKDLDFDELDRAVNTLMGNVTDTTEPAKQDDTRVLAIPETLKDNRPPVLPVGEVTVSPQPEKEHDSVAANTSRSTPQQARPAPLAARRGGRFMDVVPPSSSMKKPMPSQGVSRQGVNLSPLAEPVEQKQVPDTVSTAVIASPEQDEVPVERLSSPSDTANEWPDPLEFASAADATDDVRDETIEVPVEQDEPAEPLSSPFLADAKVEKRPLGLPTAEYAAPAQVEDPVDEVQPAIPEELADEMPAVQLPEELQGDVMAIESGASEETSTTPVAEEATAASRDAVPEVQESAPRTAATVAAPAPSIAMAAGSGSIPQQYREEPSTGDQTTGSIYDIASYHQPLEHPAKKKAGWLWVIWVLVLLILGAGGGALAYLYLLQ